MTAPPEHSSSSGPFINPPAIGFPEAFRHLEPILRGDIFDSPLPLEEVWRCGPLELSREQLTRRLNDNGPATPATGRSAWRRTTPSSK